MEQFKIDIYYNLFKEEEKDHRYYRRIKMGYYEPIEYILEEKGTCYFRRPFHLKHFADPQHKALCNREDFLCSFIKPSRNSKYYYSQIGNDALILFERNKQSLEIFIFKNSAKLLPSIYYLAKKGKLNNEIKTIIEEAKEVLIENGREYI